MDSGQGFVNNKDAWYNGHSSDALSDSSVILQP